MKFKLLSCLIASSLLISGCANLAMFNKKNVPVTTVQEQSIFSKSAAKAVMIVAAPDDGTVAIEAKPDDAFVREVETATAARLHQAVYSVALNLPEKERQKGDRKNVPVAGDTKVQLDIIPYTDSSFTELVVLINNERYSRLFNNQNRVPKPISNWTRRTAVSEESDED